MSYYYLVASLPALSFGAPNPISSGELFTRCVGMLKPDHLTILAAVQQGQAVAGNPFAEAWTARETQLRNAVARSRGTRLGLDSRSFQRDHAGYDVALEQAVSDALAQHTPLEREQGLDRWRWRLADELALFDPFGLGVILAFALKLRIAERWAGLTESAGQHKLDEIIQTKTTAQDQAAPGTRPDIRTEYGTATEMSEP
ncbi:MAG: DUF2764 family protein [Rhodocyclaceae bacterium]|nr:MAG: DUF2764 family protein [Rhodocyclaceae bacterium]